MIKRFLVAPLAALMLLAAVPAFAKGNDAKFPMKADVFQQHVDTRISRARADMEKRLKDSKASEADAKAERAKFDAIVAKVNEATKKATADGTVTKDEAKDVRTAGKGLHAGKHHGKAKKS